MNGFSRSVRCAGIFAVKYAIAATLLAVVYCVYFGVLFKDVSWDLPGILANFAKYEMFAGILFCTIYGMIGFVAQLPFEISCGGLRKHVVIRQYLSTLMAFAMTGMVAFVTRIIAGTMDAQYAVDIQSIFIPLVLALLSVILLSSIGGICTLLFGKKGYLIIVAAFSAIFGGVNGFLVTNDSLRITSFSANKAVFIAMGVLLVIDCLSILLAMKVVSRYEVKM